MLVSIVLMPVSFRYSLLLWRRLARILSWILWVSATLIPNRTGSLCLFARRFIWSILRWFTLSGFLFLLDLATVNLFLGHLQSKACVTTDQDHAESKSSVRVQDPSVTSCDRAAKSNVSQRWLVALAASALCEGEIDKFFDQRIFEALGSRLLPEARLCLGCMEVDHCYLHGTHVSWYLRSDCFWDIWLVMANDLFLADASNFQFLKNLISISSLA